ncbi:hypothetical protein AJ78_08040 [Emergomyces pasteurianus Ep9510]|uniref:Uncharacterized protein n=1 Tax=Emergomyces pasteurianus Ep9510 TaxID=1447872 RepID=A0A1J9P432_9EURO|nr:hypothetical protein AJ78_08040 [Emergomyces pasteurianus Ep9510]
MLIDGTEPRRVTDGTTGDVTETYNANESVYVRLTARLPGFELCDSLGRHVREAVVCFDPDFVSMQQRAHEARQLQTARKQFNIKHDIEHFSALQSWRINQRRWEVELLQTEWEEGNVAIFPPGTTEGNIREAVQDLRAQNTKEAFNKPNSRYIGRSEAMVVRKPRRRLDSPIDFEAPSSEPRSAFKR